MWTDTLKLEEVLGTLRAAEALASTTWASPVLTRAKSCLERLRLGLVDIEAYRTNPLTAAEHSLLFEIRFAAALTRVGATAQYEHLAGIGNSSIDFRINLTPPWLVELVSLHETDAFKEASWSAGNLSGYILSSDAEDPRQSSSGEMLKAQERICEKVYDRKRKTPVKFPLPRESIHLLMVDSRGYGGNGKGDEADWWQIAIGPDGLSSDLVQFWHNPKTNEQSSIKGLFEPACPLVGAPTIQERIHFIGFVCEQEFGNNEIQRSTHYMANRLLFKDEKAAKTAFNSWVLKADISAHASCEDV